VSNEEGEIFPCSDLFRTAQHGIDPLIDRGSEHKVRELACVLNSSWRNAGVILAESQLHPELAMDESVPL
jgi:hypothetical protein